MQILGPSRADDMESLAYTVVFLLRGSLPWQRMSPNEIFPAKQLWSGNDLGFGYPPVFGDFVNYTRGLNFEDKPDYAEWKGRFQSLLTSVEAEVVVGTPSKRTPDPKPTLRIRTEPPTSIPAWMTPLELEYINIVSFPSARVPTRRDLIEDEKATIRGRLARIKKLPAMSIELCLGDEFMLTEEQEDQDEQAFGKEHLEEIDKFWL